MYSAEVEGHSGTEERFPAISRRLVRCAEDLEGGLEGEGEEGEKENGGEIQHIF